MKKAYVIYKEECSADGCERPAASRGMCGAHYQQHRRFGSLAPISVQHGGHPRKLTAAQVLAARRLKGVCTLNELAKRFGVSSSVIWKIQHGMTYTDIEDPPAVTKAVDSQ